MGEANLLDQIVPNRLTVKTYLQATLIVIQEHQNANLACSMTMQILLDGSVLAALMRSVLQQVLACIAFTKWGLLLTLHQQYALARQI